MTGFYEDMQATATGLIAEFGMALYLLRQAGEPDPIEGEVSGAGESALATRGVFLSRTVGMVRESLAEGAERMAVIDASVAPRLNDRLRQGTDVFKLVRIDEIKPAELPLAYILHVAR